MPSVHLANLANPAHQAAIVELLDMYCRDTFGDSRPLPDDVCANLIPGLIRHGGARVLLAYENDLPAGIAICLLGFSTFRARPVLNIHDLAVAPPFRGQGIGQALLAAATAEARAAGCSKVTLEVRSDNVVAQRAYRRAGFQSTEPETWFWSLPLD